MRFAHVLPLVLLVACDKSEPTRAEPEPAPANVEPAKADPPAPEAGPVEPELATPTPPAAPTTPNPTGWQSNTEGVLLPEGYALQLATRREYADAQALLQQLDGDASTSDMRLRPYLLRGPKFWWVMAGDFVAEYEAEDQLPDAKLLLGDGGMVRKLREFCPGMKPRAEARAFDCVKIEREPEPVAPGRPVIQHPPAKTVLVLTTSNASFGPGQRSFNHKPKYRTFQWQVDGGPLPEAGPGPMIEVLDMLLVSDGKQLHELLPRRVASTFHECDCTNLEPDSENWPVLEGTFEKSLGQLDARPHPNGTERALIEATDFDGMQNCFDEADHVAHDLQIAGIAGSLVFVVDYEFSVPPCAMAHEDTGMTMRVLDLSGAPAPTLAQLEAQLDPAVTKAARRRVFDEIAYDFDADEPGEYTAQQLDLVAVYLRLKPKDRSLRLQYGDQVCWMCMDNGTWGHAWITGSSKIDFEPSSILTPPEDIAALLAWVWREHPDETVIGWSRL